MGRAGFTLHLETDMNRNKTVIAAAARRQAKPSAKQLGFTVWLTPSPATTSAEQSRFQRRIEDYLSEHDLLASGAQLQMLIWADDRSLSATDQVDLLIWAVEQPGVTAVELGPLVPHTGAPGERGSQPMVVARFSDLCLIPIVWLYRASRLNAQQVIEMLGGFRSTATVH
jgi:hypothetical protein